MSDTFTLERLNIGINCANSFLVDQSSLKTDKVDGIAICFLKDMLASIFKNKEMPTVGINLYKSPKMMMEDCESWDQAWAMGRQFRSSPIPSRTGWVLVYFWKVSDNPSHPTTSKNHLKSAKNPMNIPF